MRRLATVLLVAAPLVASCHNMHRDDGTPRSAMVQFTNEFSDQADVYVVVPAVSDIRLGTVTGGHTRTFVLPSRVVGRNINLVARLFNQSQTIDSGPVMIANGSEVRALIPLSGGRIIVEASKK